MLKRAILVAAALVTASGAAWANNSGTNHPTAITPAGRSAASQIMASFSFSCITFQVANTAPSVQITNNGPGPVPAGTKIHWVVKQSSGDYVFPAPLPPHYITVLNGVARSGLGDCVITVVQ